MDTLKTIDLSLYSQLILIYMFTQIIRNTTKEDVSAKFFLGIVVTIFINNFLETASWFVNGADGPMFSVLNHVLPSILLAFNSLPAVAWIIYFDFKIFNDLTRIKKNMYYYLIPFFISTLLIVINIFTNVVFTIDTGNIYSRNLGMYIIIVMTFLLVIGMFIISRRYKKLIDGRIIESMFWFMTIPLTAGVFQAVFYGIPLIWPAFTLSTLIAYNLVEKDAMLKDALTGISTRGQLGYRMKYMLKHKQDFSIVMIDMDDFKMINDSYGHAEGDAALLTVVSILKNSVKSYDFVCRYGGDEFMLLIESETENAYVPVMNRILETIKSYNDKAIKPYKLQMSFGGYFVKAPCELSVHQIQTIVDERMYEDKKK